MVIAMINVWFVAYLFWKSEFKMAFSQIKYTFLFPEIPSMQRAPQKMSRGATTITVRWAPWRRPADSGDGPVESYILYYKPADAEDWLSRQQDTTRVTLTGLQENTKYMFKVAPVHELGFEGQPSPLLNTSTCGREYSMVIHDRNQSPSLDSNHTLIRHERMGSMSNWRWSRGWFNTKMPSYQYRNSHCGDKMILWLSYLHNGNSYTDKIMSLYWIRAL